MCIRDRYWGTKEGLDNPRKFRIDNRKGKYWVKIEDHKGKEHLVKSTYRNWEDLYQGQKLKARKSLIFGFYKGLKEPLN